MIGGCLIPIAFRISGHLNRMPFNAVVGRHLKRDRDHTLQLIGNILLVQRDADEEADSESI